MNDYFQFKQFVVYQDKTQMKLSTDSVILGAWADCKNANKILDIGTGTGILALMMAQKYPNAKIWAIDIDPDSIKQAIENFSLSPWKDRLVTVNQDVRRYNPGFKFDCIISNPPYYQNALKSKVATIARHSLTLSYEELAQAIERLLSPQGYAFIIIPFQFANEFEQIFNFYYLFCQEKLIIFSTHSKPPKRVIFKFAKKIEVCKQKELIIQVNGKYTEEFIELTKPFYLKF